MRTKEPPDPPTSDPEKDLKKKSVYETSETS